MDSNDIYAIEDADTLGKHKEINKILSERLIDLAVEIEASSLYSDENFLNSKIVNRYKGVNKSIFSSIQINDDCSINEENTSEISRLTLSWIALGSALESSIQLFLISYKHNYENNPFAKWDDFEDEPVKEKVDTILQDLRAEGIITGKQKRRLTKKFIGFINLKKNGFDIDKILLFDLINFFFEEVLTDEILNISGYQGELFNEINLKNYLHNIRKNRNVIHIFTNDNLDDWNSFDIHLKIYHILLLILIDRMGFLEAEIEDMERINNNLMQQYDFR